MLHRLATRLTGVAWLGLVCFAAPGLAQDAPCLPIRHVEVQGVESLPEASVRQAVMPFEGRCLGLAGFNAPLKAVTELYIEAGLITSRVYLPEQDLSTGVLRLAAVEGRIENVVFNGRERQLWERFTFPGIRDRVADLREIEQGLDNIRSMPSYQGVQMTLDAGSKSGLSVLQVAAVPDPKPWRLSFSTDNYGFEGDGEFNPTIGLGWDNLLGVNDSWDFSYTSAVDQAPFAIGEPGQSSQQAAIGLTIPYGRWAYTLRQSWSAYETEIPGAISPIPVDGDSLETSFRARRLLGRDEVSKTHFALDLTRSHKRNNIAGVRIATSSRVLTWLGAELSHQRAWRDGQLSGTLRFEQGIRALGAEDAGDQPSGQPDAQYSLVMLKADYEKSWQLSSGPGFALTWISTAKLQYSPDRLYGGQQFLLGGNATARGSKISLAEGSSGAFWRNELWYRLHGPGQDSAFAAWLGYPVLYAGLDAGRVFGQSDIAIPGGSALGGILGLRMSGGRISFDLGYAKILAVSDRLQKPEGHVRVALGVSF
ncbi:ShlB/FhaC/HecB family hemolysin secretion/activation protein [Paracoccus sp. (in: a-proteobacteria)]|uniref:ShlB/FhaC/HecB family hemolysin secretion/activation protein n=1 Tax=Paracoccus sp. TaxID=267 RepID=UPI0028A941C9|nr:ShlB/FhaC/HecB family hemolysin secretion/activation protein [Paracoccus sp. (in: a-proteobacteria)]